MPSDTWKLVTAAAAGGAAALLFQRLLHRQRTLGAHDSAHHLDANAAGVHRSSSIKNLGPGEAKVFKVVLTGGPCGGKSSSLDHMCKTLTAEGFDVLCVPEVPTILMNGGAQYPGVDGGKKLVEFETALIQAQMQLERSFIQIGESTGRPTVVILDRGLLDVGAYLPAAVWTGVILAENGLTEASLAARYDLVLHLVTAADGAEKFYTTENNAARTETAEEARALDKKIRKCYTAHPNLKIIDNNGNFDDKLQHATQHVLQLVGAT